MAYALVPLTIAGMDWLALLRGWRRVDYLAKPAVILSLLVWIWLAEPGPPTVRLLVWVQTALTFSLLGDVFLMLPAERFTAGLVAFLLGHLAYIAAFNPPPLQVDVLTLAILAVVALGGGWLYRRIHNGLSHSGQADLQIPVLIYALVISLMLASAANTLTRPAWPTPAALLTAGGATLFFLSDSLLAWNRFVRLIPQGRLKVRILYHLGQILLVAGSLVASGM